MRSTKGRNKRTKRNERTKNTRVNKNSITKFQVTSAFRKGILFSSSTSAVNLTLGFLSINTACFDVMPMLGAFLIIYIERQKAVLLCLFVEGHVFADGISST